MKSQKGITLITLTVYIIGLAIVIAMVAVVSGFFYNNIEDVATNIKPNTEIAKFYSFFSEEMNYDNIKVLEYDEDYIVFSNGVQYAYIEENQGIYKDRVKISEGVSRCKFRYYIENGKHMIGVEISIENTNVNREFALGR